jgi:hypothetical protein|tara:strand:+ start:2055 stop:2321 length:267 start_codon:yes stop_codon:yes gene_type:complete
MDEYLVEVLIDDEPETLKTFANSIYSVIDSMITFEGVQDIFKVTNTSNDTIWNVEEMDVNYLRKLRSEIDPNLLTEYLKDEALGEVKH